MTTAPGVVLIWEKDREIGEEAANLENLMGKIIIFKFLCLG